MFTLTVHFFVRVFTKLTTCVRVRVCTLYTTNKVGRKSRRRKQIINHTVDKRNKQFRISCSSSLLSQMFSFSPFRRHLDKFVPNKNKKKKKEKQNYIQMCACIRYTPIPPTMIRFSTTFFILCPINQTSIPLQLRVLAAVGSRKSCEKSNNLFIINAKTIHTHTFSLLFHHYIDFKMPVHF